MRRESDCAEEKAPAKGDGGAECAMRARKRKADVATFLQDPDEEIAKVEMTRKKQYENQYLIIIMSMVRQVRGYQMLYSNGQGRLSTLADEECKTLQLIQVALESLQEMRTVLV